MARAESRPLGGTARSRRGGTVSGYTPANVLLDVRSPVAYVGRTEAHVPRSESRFKPHPLVEKLAGARGEAGAVKLVGYFGSAADGVVKLYPSLDDLSVYFNLLEADILHVEDAPADQLPHGGSYVWVKADARVERCAVSRVATEARFLAGDIAARMAGGPAVAYRAPAAQALVPETGGGPACNVGSLWPCSVAWGYCLASNDMPCAHTEQYWCPGLVYTQESCFTCAGYTCVANCYSAGCPPSVRLCPTDVGRITRCACEVASARCGGARR